MEVLQRQMDALAEELKKVKNEMAEQGLDLSASVVRFLGECIGFLPLFVCVLFLKCHDYGSILMNIVFVSIFS